MITEEELRAEWQGLEAVVSCPNDPGLTIVEMSERDGSSLRSMQRRVKRLVREGLLVQGWASRKDSLGRTMRVPVYRKATK